MFVITARCLSFFSLSRMAILHSNANNAANYGAACAPASVCQSSLCAGDVR